MLFRSLAETMFGEEDAMIRIDMSEYMEKHSTSRMIGSPPGYIGHDEGGQLTEKVRRKPYSVVLLDEIEKAHPDVFNLLLQVLEDGRLTDSKGRTVDFRNTILIMTSNVGASTIKKSRTLGFNVETEENNYKEMKEKVMDELKRAFRPEFLNRLDEIIVFHSLEKKHMKEIAKLMVQDVTNRLKENGYLIQVTDGALDVIIEDGYDSEYGARPLRRSIQRNIEDRLSEELLQRNLPKNQLITLTAKEGKIIMEL